MTKYVVCCEDAIISRGESGYYDDFRDLVPQGFRYVWAFKSPELLIINVEPGAQRRVLDDKDLFNMQIIGTWDNDKIEPYRMKTA